MRKVTGTCEACGGPLPPKHGRGRPRKWCSEYCRSRQYDLVCVDCGGRVNGTTPSDWAGREPRCRLCTAIQNGAKRKVWTRDTLIEAIREWNDLYGEPPAQSDWLPWTARNLLHDDDRARRYEDANAERSGVTSPGRWPSVIAVYREFDGWNAALMAAGFEGRPGHGGGGNEARRRSQRLSTR